MFSAIFIQMVISMIFHSQLLAHLRPIRNISKYTKLIKAGIFILQPTLLRYHMCFLCIMWPVRYYVNVNNVCKQKPLTQRWCNDAPVALLAFVSVSQVPLVGLFVQRSQASRRPPADCFFFIFGQVVERLVRVVLYPMVEFYKDVHFEKLLSPLIFYRSS